MDLTRWEKARALGFVIGKGILSLLAGFLAVGIFMGLLAGAVWLLGHTIQWIAGVSSETVENGFIIFLLGLGVLTILGMIYTEIRNAYRREVGKRRWIKQLREDPDW